MACAGVKYLRRSRSTFTSSTGFPENSLMNPMYVSSHTWISFARICTFTDVSNVRLSLGGCVMICAFGSACLHPLSPAASSIAAFPKHFPTATVWILGRM